MAATEEENKLIVYKQLKVYLKCWEEDFLTKHGRKPQKADIQESSDDIQNKYREFWRLRNSGGSSNEGTKAGERRMSYRENGTPADNNTSGRQIMSDSQQEIEDTTHSSSAGLTSDQDDPWSTTLNKSINQPQMGNSALTRTSSLNVFTSKLAVNFNPSKTNYLSPASRAKLKKSKDSLGGFSQDMTSSSNEPPSTPSSTPAKQNSIFNRLQFKVVTPSPAVPLVEGTPLSQLKRRSFKVVDQGWLRRCAGVSATEDGKQKENGGEHQGCEGVPGTEDVGQKEYSDEHQGCTGVPRTKDVGQKEYNDEHQECAGIPATEDVGHKEKGSEHQDCLQRGVAMPSDNDGSSELAKIKYFVKETAQKSVPISNLSSTSHKENETFPNKNLKLDSGQDKLKHNKFIKQKVNSFSESR